MKADQSAVWGGQGLREQLLRGGAWAIVGRFGGAAGTLLLSAILARLLDVGVMGALFLAFSLAQGVGVLARLGLDQAALRLVAAHLGADRPDRARAVITRVLVLGSVCGVASFALTLAYGADWVVAAFDAPVLAAAVVPFAILVGVVTLQRVGAEVFRAFNDIRGASIFDGLATTSLSVVVFAVLVGVDVRVNLTEVLSVVSGAAVISLTLALVLVRRRVATLPRARVQEKLALWPVATPLWIEGVMRLLQSGADVWILAVFVMEADVAMYVAALQLVALVGAPLVAVNAALPATIADLYERGELGRLESVLRRTASLATLPALVAVPVLVFFGGPILAVTYGADYAGGAALLSILAVGQLIQLTTGSCGRTLAMTGHQDALMRIALATGLATGLGLLVATPIYGAMGAAVVVALSRSLQNLAAWQACRAKTGISTHVGLDHFLILVRGVVAMGGRRPARVSGGL